MTTAPTPCKAKSRPGEAQLPYCFADGNCGTGGNLHSRPMLHV